MEFRQLAEARVSVRQFKPEPVPSEAMREMVRLAGLAPSPNNSQPWEFIAVTRRALLDEMRAAVLGRLTAILPAAESDEARHARQKVEWYSTFFADAPLVLGVVLYPYESVVEQTLDASRLTGPQVNAMRGQPDVQAVGGAVEHLLLAATDLGYGGCWCSGPLVARDALERLLGVTPPGRLTALVAIGRPASDHAQPHSRKDVDAILRVID